MSPPSEPVSPEVVPELALLVLGSGHLALRVRSLALAQGHTLVPVPATLSRTGSGEPARFEHALRILGALEPASYSAALLVDDQDDFNLELALALISLDAQIPVVVSLFNEKIAPHLHAANPNVRILNPARIAADVFVAALDTPIERGTHVAPEPPAARGSTATRDPMLLLLVMGFAAALAAATTYFHHAEQLSWLDAFYFVIVTTATVGYGDISLLHSSAMSKWVGIGLILASTVFLWMILSLTIDRIIKTRVQLALGRHRHAQSGHVIVCGLGRLGLLVTEALLQRGERVLVIEQSEGSAALDQVRAQGADIYVGDARSLGVLSEAGTTRAKAVYSLIANDFVNLEVGLNARSLAPTLRVILRIFDQSMAKSLQEHLDIQLSYSMSAIADERFLDSLAAEPTRRA